MDKLKKLLSDAAEYFAAASPREKRMVALGAGAVIATLLFITFASFASAIQKKQDALEEKQAAFEKVRRLAADYSVREQERQMLEAKLRQSPPALMSFVDGIAKGEGIEIGSMSDNGVVGGGKDGKPRENSVEVNLGKVPQEKLTRLLEAIDKSPGVVRVRRLRVRKSSDNKETLDVTLRISTWGA